MAQHQIVRYYARWDLDNHNGRITLYDLSNSYVETRIYDNPEEFQLIVDLLRNEKPLWFDDGPKWLKTGYGASGEPVGEEES